MTYEREPKPRSRRFDRLMLVIVALIAAPIALYQLERWKRLFATVVELLGF